VTRHRNHRCLTIRGYVLTVADQQHIRCNALNSAQFFAQSPRARSNRYFITKPVSVKQYRSLYLVPHAVILVQSSIPSINVFFIAHSYLDKLRSNDCVFPVHIVFLHSRVYTVSTHFLHTGASVQRITIESTNLQLNINVFDHGHEWLKPVIKV
jgi:hypothetical protein